MMERLRLVLAVSGVAVAVGACLSLLRVALDQAWVGEDAYITFRTVDNAVSGRGLRWNADERVQTYTHPLWMLLNLPLYSYFKDVPRASTTLSLICTAAAFLVAASRHWRRPFVVAAGLFLPLFLSPSFARYSTSGFENSLSHLCVAVFAVLLLRGLDRQQVSWFGLAFAAALGVTNRLDTALVYAPPLAVLGAAHIRSVAWRRVALGLSPIFAWLVFSTIYYGFPYPNTAPAKLGTSIPYEDRFERGVYYVLDLLRHDPAGFAVMVSAGAITLGRFAQGLYGSERLRSFVVAGLGAGGIAYSGYVVSIGGAYLSGRHFTVPLFLAVVLLAEQLALLSRNARSLLPGPSRKPVGWLLRQPALWIALIAVAAGAGYTAWRRPSLPDKQQYVRAMPISYLFRTESGSWKRTRGARRFERAGERLRKQKVAKYPAVGIAAFTAKRTIIVDPYALTDPLLARLPAKQRLHGGWGPNDHFERDVPPGYMHARRTGSLDQMPDHIAAYYAALHRIVSDPVFDLERLKTVVVFNFGGYDPYREAYLEEFPPGFNIFGNEP